jgi:cell division protein ZapA (FtsZ GTPase activity inhibitor)
MYLDGVIMDKTRTVVHIAGQEFKLSGFDSEEYIQKIAVYLNRKIDEVQKTYPTLSTTHAAIMAALDITDELHKLKAEYAALKKRMARGWNTWNTRSVLSHVLLPEGFAINLGLKDYAGGWHLKEALIGEGDKEIKPGIRTWDDGYTQLNLKWHGIDVNIESATEGNDLVLLVTPLAKQRKTGALVVEVGMLWNRRLRDEEGRRAPREASEQGRPGLRDEEKHRRALYIGSDPVSDPGAGFRGRRFDRQEAQRG